MSEAPQLSQATADVEMDRARLSAAMGRIYRRVGFSGLMLIQQACLASLAERIRAEGGRLDGWVP